VSTFVTRFMEQVVSRTAKSLVTQEKPEVRRRYRDVEVSENLVAWLNLVPDSPIHGMVRNLRTLDELSKEKWSPSNEAERQRLAEAVSFGMKEAGKVFYVIRANVRYLAAGRNGEPQVHQLREDKGPYELAREPVEQFQGDMMVSYQSMAYRSFEEVIVKKCISKIQTCDVCKRWFCQKATVGAYCSRPCRMRRYKQSPKFKMQRKANDALKKKVITVGHEGSRQEIAQNPARK
jgi:hypothetical protein